MHSGLAIEFYLTITLEVCHRIFIIMNTRSHSLHNIQAIKILYINNLQYNNIKLAKETFNEVNMIIMEYTECPVDT